MKKITALLLACLMMLSLLAGCGGGNTNTKDNANVAPEDRVLHMRTTSSLLSTDLKDFVKFGYFHFAFIFVGKRAWRSRIFL